MELREDPSTLLKKTPAGRMFLSCHFSLSLVDLHKFATRLKNLGYSESTQNVYLCEIKKVIRHLVARGDLPEKEEQSEEAWAHVKGPKKMGRACNIEALPKAWDVEQIACQKDRAGALVYCLANSGMRISELLSIEVSKLSERELPKRGKFLFCEVLGKGKKYREVRLPVDALARCQEAFGSSKKLCGSMTRQNASNLVERAFRNIGCKNIRCHGLRHFFAVQCLQEDSAENVSKALGHASVTVTNDVYRDFYRSVSKELP